MEERKISRVFLAFVLLLFLTACGQKAEFQEERQSSYTQAQCLVVLLSKKEQLEELCTAHIWNTVYDIDGKAYTYAALFEQNIQTYMLELKTLSSMAEQQGIVLNPDEESKIAEAALQYRKLLQSSEISILQNSSLQEIQDLLTDYVKAQKMKAKLMEAPGLEVSESEARVAELGKIAVADREEALSLLEKIQNGEDFMNLAGMYSLETDIRIKLARNKIEYPEEDALFQLENEALSDILHLGERYYIFKMLNSYDEESTKENKQDLMSEKTLHALSGICTQYMQEQGIETDEQVWAAIRSDTDLSLDVQNFFDFYEEKMIVSH